MGSPVKKTVELFYDVISPYTWIAFEQLLRYQKKWDIDLRMKPFFYGGVLKGSGNLGPFAVKNKGTWLMEDLKLASRYYNIPIHAPSDIETKFYKVGSLPAMRFVTAVDLTKPELVGPVARGFWMKLWSKDQEIGSESSFAEVGSEAGLTGDDIKTMFANMKTAEVKERLENNTNEAVAQGAFGAPTIITTDNNGKKHLLFGSDRISYLAMLLNKKYEGPLKYDK